MSGWGVTLTGFDAATDLFDQITADFDGDTTYIAGPTVEYAIHNEYGTSKMEARPFARPAAERVQTNTATEVRRISNSQGIPLSSEENIIRCAALAVQDRMKRIADRKGVRDTGNLIGSIRIEKVS
ncbi:HK97-gp10 family putative phage morphogenesis protein [Natronorubrum halophilum]|uniref:hypothetical protein n=1 Tax=Natronorubrum halophilum TaxID=1702106 RepID=UPI0010C17DAF|nr:hypothetical protein [Natronorubrum halophilum]